jgi:serine/threonine-protein kinase RsbW
MPACLIGLESRRLKHVSVASGRKYDRLTAWLMDQSFSSSPTQTQSFPGQFDSLAPLSQFVARAASAAGFDQTAVYAVEMAVDEACTNIIEHAYGGEGRGDIECTCRVSEGELTVTLRDFGYPFDPSSVPEPDIHSGLEERSEGGLGLFLIRKLMDEVRFEFTADAGNVLTLVKRKERAA